MRIQIYNQIKQTQFTEMITKCGLSTVFSDLLRAKSLFELLLKTILKLDTSLFFLPNGIIVLFKKVIDNHNIALKLSFSKIMLCHSQKLKKILLILQYPRIQT